MKHVCIISPAYNEQGNIEFFAFAVTKQMDPLPYTYSLLFIDDGSSDNTLEKIKTLACYNQRVKYISLSRNFGHQNALKAGLDMAFGDCVISLDSDMQHPVNLIPEMLKKFEDGYDVVYTLRHDDKKVSFFKKKASSFFYHFINYLSDTRIERGGADFRLLSIKVVKIIRQLPEYDLFFRGLVKWIGFNQIAIEYKAASRTNGTTKYTFRRMAGLALSGLTAFSTRPLYVAGYLGVFFALLSFLYLPYALLSYFFNYAISGWASVIVTVAFFGGLQLMILGIIGVYMGRMFQQVKERPPYIIKESNLE